MTAIRPREPQSDPRATRRFILARAKGIPSDGSARKRGSPITSPVHAVETSIYRCERRLRRGKTTMTPRTRRTDQSYNHGPNQTPLAGALLDDEPLKYPAESERDYPVEWIDPCPTCNGTMFVEGSPDPHWTYICRAGWCDQGGFKPRNQRREAIR